ncbi:hypothetical protein AMTRI_Chr12g240940 [Amborella trichopoda]|uniref:Protein kinase domain-containing protein n=1 Tax=Amborella trichopoda TaxID=13333 RepID=W1PH33_AMBTC|nr:uncharacterized protein LOC18435486 [Amborella trichopoda]ERN07268.1 hypothetical protein AMTR_s00019p00201800 [Amborella trichopoda]|eukprot:XP_006845593.1 uncharacterized protein LOC18435486 [Amborella trichopoda]
MCKHELGSLRSSQSETTPIADQAVSTMENSSNDDAPKVKFLCSFGGSILPRPLDGKLRYVGGETRIVSVQRDIIYDELMEKMRELFDGASSLKYQQPDEDLDALVSVVNNDDVTNMMEEYEKLGAGDGFTRLRIFLFPHPDHDIVPFDTDERETERRYVDALNSLTDAPESKRQSEVDRYQREANLENCEIGVQRNNEIPLPPQYNRHQLAMPHQRSGHCSPRYGDMETPWSPAYYSSSHQNPHDSRPGSEFPSSPSGGRYRVAFGDVQDNFSDRIHEETGYPVGQFAPMNNLAHYEHQPPPYVDKPMNNLAHYEHQPSPYVDNVVWVQHGPIQGENAGFHCQFNQSHGTFEANNGCEHCQMGFPRNQAFSEPRYMDPRWKHAPHLEHSSSTNEISQTSNPCTPVECFVTNPEMKLDHGVYQKEHGDPRVIFKDPHNHERSWLRHQLNQDTRTHLTGRVGDRHVVDGSIHNAPFPHGFEHGLEGPKDQKVGVGPYMHVPVREDAGIRFDNLSSSSIKEDFYQASRVSASPHAMRLKAQNPMRAPLPESSVFLPHSNGSSNSGFSRGAEQGGSPRFSRVGVEDQNSWVRQHGSSHAGGAFDVAAAPDYLAQLTLHGGQNQLGLHFNDDGEQRGEPSVGMVKGFMNAGMSSPDSRRYGVFAHGPGNLSSTPEIAKLDILGGPAHPEATNVLHPSPSLMDEDLVTLILPPINLSPKIDSNSTGEIGMPLEQDATEESCQTKLVDASSDFDFSSISTFTKDTEMNAGSNSRRPIKEGGGAAESVLELNCHLSGSPQLSDCLSFIPDLMASAKRAALEGVEEVRNRACQDANALKMEDKANAGNGYSHSLMNKGSSPHELDPPNPPVEPDEQHDNENTSNSKIEPTNAEAEALAMGLQTIKNDDLEEIRELGSGTYGFVYHGKWKGSDVAIKRIKASCFNGRPTERERLIADFWKEASILHSLHHPNVVSFYGVVRDGPDGTLATVTEFMVNGSLKQVLQKKDRTIDRRKRLIIAMDAAFGMEYLHGKNIVHFDLKCENLLVNMRDPHRPVCKIGDLGLSKVKHHTLVSGGVRGTLPWMAPELLIGKSNMVTEKIDVYSFGICMWELLTGEEPYADMHCASIIGGIVNNTLRPQIPTWCDPEWRSLMESSWSSDPGERPSFAEISQKLRKMSAAINVK